MDRRTLFIIALVEIVALAIGVLLYYYGFVGWYVIPLSLLVPPVLAVVLMIVGFAFITSDGSNPFE